MLRFFCLIVAALILYVAFHLYELLAQHMEQEGIFTLERNYNSI